MSSNAVVLISGAGGEIGHGLIHHLAGQGGHRILALDLHELPTELRAKCYECIVGDILDKGVINRIVATHEVRSIFHLAALLSTRCERSPEMAHRVNVEGTLNLLQLAVEQARVHGEIVRFFFPSSIAVHGLPDLETKAGAGAIREEDYTVPITMYGCNKLSCEHLGRYYANHYRQLAADAIQHAVDFRAIRFPGLISAETLPSGGTSDYLPEMLHAAAQKQPYACFVREDTRIPFMAMPDAVSALLRLMEAPPATLGTHVYNITAFNPSAGEFAGLVRSAFESADISFVPHLARQGIVDSWPRDVDASRAREDWGFAPEYDLERAFGEYLLPRIRERYR